MTCCKSKKTQGQLCLSGLSSGLILLRFCPAQQLLKYGQRKKWLLPGKMDSKSSLNQLKLTVMWPACKACWEGKPILFIFLTKEISPRQCQDGTRQMFYTGYSLSQGLKLNLMWIAFTPLVLSKTYATIQSRFRRYEKMLQNQQYYAVWLHLIILSSTVAKRYNHIFLSKSK